MSPSTFFFTSQRFAPTATSAVTSHDTFPVVAEVKFTLDAAEPIEEVPAFHWGEQSAAVFAIFVSVAQL